MSNLEKKVTISISKDVEEALSFNNRMNDSNLLNNNTFATLPQPIPRQSYSAVAKNSFPSATSRPWTPDHPPTGPSYHLHPKSQTLQKQQVTQNNQPSQQASTASLPQTSLQPEQSQQGQQARLFEQQNILIGDSNIRYISPKRFPSAIAKIRCPTLQKIPEIMNSIHIPNAKKILVHLGTNDIEYLQSSTEFKDHLTVAISTIKSKAPHADIIVSAILPRGDNQQRKVMLANDIIAEFCQERPWDDQMEILFHAKINPRMLADEKHLDRVGLKIFITEIKSLFFGNGRSSSFSVW